MKICECCGAHSPDDAIVCANCGEASWKSEPERVRSEVPSELDETRPEGPIENVPVRRRRKIASDD